jgi:hypothetical protein
MGPFYAAAQAPSSRGEGRVHPQGEPLHYDGGKALDPAGLYRYAGGIAHFGTREA